MLVLCLIYGGSVSCVLLRTGNIRQRVVPSVHYFESGVHTLFVVLFDRSHSNTEKDLFK